MPDYEFEEGPAGWNGKDWIQSKGRYCLNHDSTKSDQEVIALIEKLKDIKGFGKNDAQPRGMSKQIWTLKEALHRSDRTIIVEKGIHDREGHPHIRIKLKGGSDMSFHVDLSASLTRKARSGDEYFFWDTVGVTFVSENSHSKSKWPAEYKQFAADKEGRPRGNSRVSLGTLPRPF